MFQTFCSIVSRSHIGYVLALMDSIEEHQLHPTDFHILVVDDTGVPPPALHERLYWHTIDIFENHPIIARYKTTHISKLRWSLKPVFSKFILETLQYDKVIYIDWDLFFFNNYQFLFDHLDSYRFLLTPHHRASNPADNTFSFLYNLKHGFFNAGFVGVSKKGLEILDWWTEVVTFACEPNEALGLHDDQRYLDHIPLLFKDVLIIRHNGVNLGEWHNNPNLRAISGKIYTNNEPVVCIHFTDYALFTFENASKVAIFSHWDAVNALVTIYKNKIELYKHHIDHFKDRWQLRAEQFFKAYLDLQTEYQKLLDSKL